MVYSLNGELPAGLCAIFDNSEAEQMVSNSTNKHAMVQRAVSGDRSALKLLLTETHLRLRDQIGRRIPANLRRLLDPEDVLQEVHIEVFRRIDVFQPRGTDSFQRWVATIALSRLRNAIKKHRAVKRGGDHMIIGAGDRHLQDSSVALFDQVAGPGKTPSRFMAHDEAVGAMQQAMAALPEQYERALWLVYIEGNTACDAGEKMGRTERAIHGLCRRGLRMLRDQLGEPTNFFSSSG